MMRPCCVLILVVGIIVNYVFMKTLLILKQKSYKIGVPEFGLLITTIALLVGYVYTVSNQNLQELLKSKL